MNNIYDNFLKIYKQKLKIMKNNLIPKEQRKNLSFKEKYGRCGTINSVKQFNMFKDGFFNAEPFKVPKGYNFALGYIAEPVL